MSTLDETPSVARPAKPADRRRLIALLLIAIALAVFAVPYFRGGSSDSTADDRPMALVDLIPIPKSKRQPSPSQALGTFEWFHTSIDPAYSDKDSREELAAASNETNRRVWSSNPDGRRWGLTITRGRDRDWTAQCGNGIALKLIEQNRTADMIEMVDAGGSARWRVFQDRLEQLVAADQWQRDFEGSWNGDPAASLRHPVVNVSAPLDVMPLEWRAAVTSGRFFKAPEGDSNSAWVAAGWLTGDREHDRLEFPVQIGPEYSLEFVVTRTAGKPGLMITLPMTQPSITLEIDSPSDGGWATGFRLGTNQATVLAAGSANSPEPRLVALRKHRLQCDVTKRQIDARLDGQVIATWKATPADAVPTQRGQTNEASSLILELGKASYEFTEMKLIPQGADAALASTNGAPPPPAWAVNTQPPPAKELPSQLNPAIAANLIPLQPLAAPSPDPPPPPQEEPEKPKEELPPPTAPYEPVILKGNLLTQFNGAQPGFVSVDKAEWLLHRVPEHELKVHFPGCLPPSYTLTIKFKKEEGPDALIVCLPVGSRHALVMLNAYPEKGVLSGVETDEPLFKATENVIRGKVLDTQREYLLKCVVAPNQFEVQLDGKTLAQWHGDANGLRIDPRSPKAQGEMAILARQSGYRLLNVEVKSQR